MKYDGLDYQDEFQDTFDYLFEELTWKQKEWQENRCPECDAYMVDGLCEYCDCDDDLDDTGEESFYGY